MKKIFLTFVLSTSLIFATNAFAMDSKAKVIGTMAAYGVVGGALLGTASLAFGTSGRAIAKGASLGLYGGLIFGAYVITSYEMKKRGYGETREDYYPDSQGPYENQNSMNKIPELSDYSLVSNDKKKDPKEDPLFYLNFVSYQF